MQLTSRYRDFSGASIVEAAHMELAEPSIKTAFAKCVEQGATKIICHPYFRSRGRHVKKDIPELVAEAAKENPFVTYTITDPLGAQQGVLNLIDLSIKNIDRNST